MTCDACAPLVAALQRDLRLEKAAHTDAVARSYDLADRCEELQQDLAVLAHHILQVVCRVQPDWLRQSPARLPEPWGDALAAAFRYTKPEGEAL